jgi:hypothetical protein
MRPGAKLIVDGSDVIYMSAAGVRALAGVLHGAEALNARVVFCRFTGPASDCLEVSGFAQLLDVADSVEEASAGLTAGDRKFQPLAPAPCCGLITCQAEARPRDSERGSDASAPDGDRALTIWTWLCLLARPVVSAWFGACACRLPGRSRETGPGWGERRHQHRSLAVRRHRSHADHGGGLPAAASADRPSTTSNLSAGARISVAPGDVLKVRIFEPYEGSIFPTIQRPGADLGVQRVTDSGTINVPYAGTVAVAGST